MSKSILLIIASVVLIGLLPFVPWMIQFRTRVLRGLRLRRLANWHEKNSIELIAIVRIIFLVIAVIIAAIGIAGQWYS